MSRRANTRLGRPLTLVCPSCLRRRGVVLRLHRVLVDQWLRSCPRRRTWAWPVPGERVSKSVAEAAADAPQRVSWASPEGSIMRVNTDRCTVDTMSATTASDFAQCIEWASEQSWSDGKVGLLGISWVPVPSACSLPSICSKDETDRRQILRRFSVEGSSQATERADMHHSVGGVSGVERATSRVYLVDFCTG